MLSCNHMSTRFCMFHCTTRCSTCCHARAALRSSSMRWTACTTTLFMLTGCRACCSSHARRPQVGPAGSESQCGLTPKGRLRMCSQKPCCSTKESISGFGLAHGRINCMALRRVPCNLFLCNLFLLLMAERMRLALGSHGWVFCLRHHSGICCF